MQFQLRCGDGLVHARRAVVGYQKLHSECQVHSDEYMEDVRKMYYVPVDRTLRPDAVNCMACLHYLSGPPP